MAKQTFNVVVPTINNGTTIEEVRADIVELRDGGVLAFYNQNDDLLVAYAPGAWQTVFPKE